MVEAIQNRGIGEIVHAGLETGGQLGLSLGLSALAGLPFNSTKWKLIATGIGGGLPMIAKSFKGVKKEFLLNTAELAAGIAVGFLPSMAMMFVASAGLSFGFELFRQTVLQDHNLKDALSSAVTAAGFSSLIGGMFYAVPHLPAKKLFKHWGGGDEKRWNTVLEESIYDKVKMKKFIDKTRQRVAIPNDQWFLRQEARQLRQLSQVIDAIEMKLVNYRASDSSMEPLFQPLDTIYLELKYATFARKKYWGPAVKNDRHSVCNGSFLHELGNELVSIGYRLPDVPSKELASLKDLIVFYREQSSWQRSLELMKKRFSRESQIAISSDISLAVTKREGFEAAIIVRELLRNATRVAKRRKIKDPTIRITTTSKTKIEVSDNVGGFTAPAERGANEGGLSGSGTTLIDQLTQLNGWRLTHEPIDGGTKFVLDLS